MRTPSVLFYFYLAGTFNNIFAEQQDCLSRDYGYGGTVCVCNSEHCDTIPTPERVEQPQYLVYTSNLEGLRFKKDVGEFGLENTDNQIVINYEKKYQEIMGWGSAFTDASVLNFDALEEDARDKLLRAYFSDEGLEYNNCRVPIGGTDFSLRGYSYDDGDLDPELENFALAEEDHDYKIPYIKRALNLTNGKMELFASAWTAPKWMKTNGEYAGYGFLKQEYYQTWADYHIKFLDAYKEEGIEFWGLTTGNEPRTVLVPGNKINIVGWNSTELGKWVENNFGPTIRNSSYSNLKIMIHDDQRLFLPQFVDQALESSTARDYIDGIAVHWYTDGLIPASLLSDTHDHFPEKFIFGTEASNQRDPEIGPVVLGSWERGEAYSNDIIEDLQNWVTGWVDWCFALDVQGGPSYIENYVDATIIVNATGGEFYKQPAFYALGHFAKFIPKGLVRIDAGTTLSDDLGVVTLQKPDNGTVVVILNKNEEVVPVSIDNGSGKFAQLQLSARSISTVLFW